MLTEPAYPRPSRVPAERSRFLQTTWLLVHLEYLDPGGAPTNQQLKKSLIISVIIDNNIVPDRLAGPKALYPNHWRKPVGTTFNVISYYAVWAEQRTNHLPNTEQMRYILCHIFA